MKILKKAIPIFILVTTVANTAYAAIALDRTRVVFNGEEKTISLTITNFNKELPYLAQGWIEDEQGQKIESPLTVLPPVQRIEPGEKSQVKIQSLPNIKALPQDRESLFYFNLREIPPVSDKQNVLQIALQTRIKLFYRPKAIYASRTDLDKPWQEEIILTRNGNNYEVNNPTAYFVTLVDATNRIGGTSMSGFKPVMVAPKSNLTIANSVNALGSSPVLTYVNDYGGRPKLVFSCNGTTCKVSSTKSE